MANDIIKKYVFKIAKDRKIEQYSIVGIEILKDNTLEVSFDDEVRLQINFKDKKTVINSNQKQIKINLQDIRDIKWIKGFKKGSAKIIVWHFNKDYYVLYANLRNREDIANEFKVTRTCNIRGGGFLPLSERRKERDLFMSGWKKIIEDELPLMWNRSITVSQRYKGPMVYDGNYFDLFDHAQGLYILGYYYPVIILCRSAVEQALISILIKSGHPYEIYKKKGSGNIKSIENLVSTCRSYVLFEKKPLINKTSAKKIGEINRIASDLVHLKQELKTLNSYKKDALLCMDNLHYVIKTHLNFIKDTGVVSGYKITGKTKRLQ
ncbi:MAG: hypothetical protein PHR55_03545 [Bacilli bacterium]|nr:hypothetical protein [Bacilli bacterium]